MAKITAEELASIRARFIEDRQDALTSLGQKLQRKIVDMLVEKFVQEFERTDGNLVLNGKNIRATAALDAIFDEFMRSEQVKLVLQFAKDINKITDLNIQYFATFTDRKDKFLKSAEKVKELMRLRLGVSPNSDLYRGGFLDSFIRDTTLRAQAKFLILHGVTAQLPMNKVIDDLKRNVMGPAGVDGAIVSKYKTFLFDTYQQHDGATQKTFAEDLGLKCFLYAGGLIDTSREFCQERNGKVFTLEEAQDWINDPHLPRTKEERKTGQVLNYNPIIDRGRWRCRHHINFIPNSWAIRLRPELKDILN